MMFSLWEMALLGGVVLLEEGSFAIGSVSLCRLDFEVSYTCSSLAIVICTTLAAFGSRCRTPGSSIPTLPGSCCVGNGLNL